MKKLKIKEGENIKLQKFLQQIGYSRRKAGELILSSQVKVNGQIINQPWYNVNDNNVVQVVGDTYKNSSLDKVIYYYYVLHKPKGYVSSLYDPKEEKTIGNLVREKLPALANKLRIAGRLDKDVTGVLILTNDGDLINILTNAQFGVQKVYLAKVKGIIKKNKLEEIKNGINDNGERLKCEDVNIIYQSLNYSIVELTMIKGKKHEVKRLMKYIGCPILSLIRTSHGPINISLVPNEGNIAKIEGQDLEKLLALKVLKNLKN